MCQLTIEKKQWYRAISISIFSSLQHNLKEFVTELFDSLFIAVLYAEVNRVFKMKIVQIESKICKFILVVCLKNCIDAAYSYTCRKFRGCLYPSLRAEHTGELCKSGWSDRNAVWGRLVRAIFVHIGTLWRILLNDPCAQLRCGFMFNYFGHLLTIIMQLRSKCQVD